MKMKVATMISGSITIVAHLFLARTDAFIPSYRRAVPHRITRHTQQDVNRICGSLQESRIPEEFEAAVYIAESKSAGAEGRQSRIVSYISIAFIFLLLGIVDTMKQSGMDLSSYEWISNIPSSGSSWVAYVDIVTAVLMGGLIVTESNEREEAALEIWKGIQEQSSGTVTPLPPQPSIQTASTSPTPVPQSPLIFFSPEPQRGNLSKSPPSTAVPVQSVSAPPSPRPAAPTLQPPPLTPPASFSVRDLSPTSYSKQLADVAENVAKQERLASDVQGTKQAEKERLTNEAKRLAMKAERLAVEIAKKNEEERLAIKAVQSDEERAAKKLDQERMVEEAAKLAVEAERIAIEVIKNAERDRRVEEQLFAAEKLEADRMAAYNAATEEARIQEEKTLANRLAASKRADEERVAFQMASAKRLEEQRLASEKLEADRMATFRAATEEARIQREKALANRLAASKRADEERVAFEMTSAKRLEEQLFAAEKLEADRMAAYNAATKEARIKEEISNQLEEERLARETANKETTPLPPPTTYNLSFSVSPTPTTFSVPISQAPVSSYSLETSISTSTPIPAPSYASLYPAQMPPVSVSSAPASSYLSTLTPQSQTTMPASPSQAPSSYLPPFTVQQPTPSISVPAPYYQSEPLPTTESLLTTSPAISSQNIGTTVIRTKTAAQEHEDHNNFIATVHDMNEEFGDQMVDCATILSQTTNNIASSISQTSSSWAAGNIVNKGTLSTEDVERRLLLLKKTVDDMG